MQELFVFRLFEEPILFLIVLVLMVFSICLHEFCHAWTAKLCGDSTAAENGYLTLNPLKVMGVYSLIMLLMFGIGWGRVPVNNSRITHKYQRILVDLAGIIANFVLGIVFTAVLVLMIHVNPESQYTTPVIMVAALNFVMAMFNLLPIPPLDGYSAVCEIFPAVRQFGRTEFTRGAMLLLFFAMFSFGFRYLFIVAVFLLQSGLLLGEFLLGRGA